VNIGPFDYQAIFESDVWNVFYSLGLGYDAYLVTPSNGKTVWMIPPKGTQLANFYMDMDVIQELINKGLVRESSELPDKHPYSAEKSYRLTDKGQSLSTQVQSKAFEEGQRVFVEIVRPVKK
jgi:hypothetical protein